MNEILNETARKQLDKKFKTYSILHFWQVRGSAISETNINLVMLKDNDLYFIHMNRQSVVENFSLVVDKKIAY